MKNIFLLLITIICLSAHAQIITTVVGSGTFGNNGNGGPATAASLLQVPCVAVDLNGNIYVSTNGYMYNLSVVRKVNTAGIISRFAGNDTAGFSGDNGPATNAKLNSPGCIAFDKKGNILIADAYTNYRVRAVDTAGIITTVAGNGTLIPSGDGGPATAAGIGGGAGICYDTSGNLYIAASSNIRRVDTNGIITTIAGGTTPGPLGDGGPATAARFSSLGQISFDSHGNLYVCDVGNNRVRRINTAGIITTIAGNGVQGYSGDGGPATAAELYSPFGVVVDACDNVYISDTYNNRIRVVNGSGIIKTFAGTGISGYSGDGGPASAATFHWPGTVWLDKNSSVYIADALNFVIRYIHMDSCINTTATADPVPTGIPTLQLYPSPASGILTVATYGYHSTALTITGIMGNVVLHQPVTSDKTDIDISALAPGLYYLIATGPGGTLARRFVKQ